MVKKRPIGLKKAKHACSLCGDFTKGNVVSISREREHRNSVLICKRCVDELKSAADEFFAEEKHVCPACKKEFLSLRGLAIHSKKCNCKADE